MNVASPRTDRRAGRHTGACDPVALWLKARPGRAPGAWRSMRCVFDGAPVLIRCNSPDVIASLGEQVATYYPDGAPLIPGRKASCIDIRIIDHGRDRRIVLAAGVGAAMQEALDLPVPLATVVTDEFVHFRWDGTESFWRPFDLLASLTSSTQFSTATHVRLLVARAASGDDAPATRAGWLHAKLDRVAPGLGPHAEWNPLPGLPMDETVDLVRTMMVRAQGHFCLHAATVALGERGVLLMGPSGSGKTTTALALLRGGYDLLSDEHSLLRAGSEGVRVSGFRSAPRVAGRALETLAQLEETLQFGREFKTPLTLPPESFGRSQWLRPSAMFFLCLRPGASDHMVRTLPVEEAFVRVTSQVLDPTNVFRKAEQAQLLIRLVEDCPAYELVLGANLGSLPDLVRGVVESTA